MDSFNGFGELLPLLLGPGSGLLVLLVWLKTSLREQAELKQRNRQLSTLMMHTWQQHSADLVEREQRLSAERRSDVDTICKALERA